MSVSLANRYAQCAIARALPLLPALVHRQEASISREPRGANPLATLVECGAASRHRASIAAPVPPIGDSEKQGDPIASRAMTTPADCFDSHSTASALRAAAALALHVASRMRDSNVQMRLRLAGRVGRAPAWACLARPGVATAARESRARLIEEAARDARPPTPCRSVSRERWRAGMSRKARIGRAWPDGAARCDDRADDNRN